MSTILRVQLDQQAHDACALVAQAQYQLLVVRERQLAEADREAMVYAESERRIEQQSEAVYDKVSAVCNANGLGVHGTTLEMLERIASMLAALQDAFQQQLEKATEAQTQLQELGALVADAKARGFWPLAERPEVPVFAELGFGAPEWATMFQASMRGQNQPVTPDHDLLVGWFSNAIMRGYDEHARKYGKLIELAVMGDRNRGSKCYTVDAELAIMGEADKFVDHGSPPAGWLPPEERK